MYINCLFVLTFRTIFVHNMFSPCFAKRRASDKDLPVSKNSQACRYAGKEAQNMSLTFLSGGVPYKFILHEGAAGATDKMLKALVL